MSENSFRVFLSSTLNLSPKDKVSIAKTSLVKMIEYLESMDAPQENINKILINFTRLFVSSDAKTVGDEYSFFKAVTGIDITPNEFYEMTNNGSDPKFVDATLEFVSNFPKEVIEAFLTYGMMIMSCDDNINYQESDLIKRILALFSK